MRDYLLSSDLMRRPLHVHAIEVCEKYCIGFDELIGKGRTTEQLQARAEFAVSAKKDGASFPQIAKFMGGRHHTSIIHLVKKYRRSMGMLDGAN